MWVWNKNRQQSQWHLILEKEHAFQSIFWGGHWKNFGQKKWIYKKFDQFFDDVIWFPIKKGFNYLQCGGKWGHPIGFNRGKPFKNKGAQIGLK